MQQKQTQNPQRRTSLYSKFKLWCAYHRIPLLVIPIAVLAILACAALAIGGAIAGWDFVGFITSPTGILVAVVAVLIILAVVKFFVLDRRD